MPKIALNRTGNLRKGVFYRFSVPFEDVPYFPPRKDSIVVPRMPTQDQLVLAGQEGYMWLKASGVFKSAVETKDCSLDKEHVTHRYFTKFGGEAYGGQKRSPLIPASETDDVFLSDELRGRVQSLKLRGARIDPVALTLSDNGPMLDGFWALQFVGKAKLRLPKFVDVPNQCPHCGKAKIICESCGDWPAYCAVCEKQMIIIASKHGGKDDPRIPFEDAIDPIEGKTWDGSDLIQASFRNFASKRFIDWLLRIHAAPFYAEPVYFCVDGMSDQQKKWFNELQKPLEV